MLQHVNISALLGYSVSAITVTLGALVLVGLFLPEAVPHRVRVVFGVVIVLLGIYRFVITRVQVMQSKRERDE